MHLDRPDLNYDKNLKFNSKNTRRFFSCRGSPIFKENEIELPNDLLQGMGQIPEKSPKILKKSTYSNRFEK